MKVLLIHIDGKLPNMALMRLSSFHKSKGDTVMFSKSPVRDLFNRDCDRVYASSIFTFSGPKRDRLKENFPEAILGGTGNGVNDSERVEKYIGNYKNLDYSIYPDFEHSIGFSQRGCRLKCSFCFVPKKEGKISEEQSLSSIWRGGGYAKNIVLLDNDFFGQKNWRERVRESIDGKFKICLNQGINVRLIDDEGAEALSQMNYRDSKFKNKRIYTAWDNLGDKEIFLNGMKRLFRYGIKPSHIMAYMLIGYKPNETWDDIFLRYNMMKDMGIMPYPMVYNNERKDLKKFQKWVVMRYDQIVPWKDFNP